MSDYYMDKPLESLDDLRRRFELPGCIRGEKKREEAMNTAYKALVALERGRREDYLTHRRKLASLKWAFTDRQSLKFHLDDNPFHPVSWTGVVHAAVSPKAAALAHEAEESAWETIYPGCSRIERMLQTERMWESAKHMNSHWLGKHVIEMMDCRFSQVIATGSKKQTLISTILDSQPTLRQQYRCAFSEYERERLKALFRRRRRELRPVEVEAPKPLSPDAEMAVKRPVGAPRL